MADEKVEPVPERKPLSNQEKATALFDAFPHIHAIWFDATGAWRFYHTPGTKIIERPTKK